VSVRRLFFALCPDDAARRQLAALPSPHGSRAVHPADLHFTLRFLGSLDAAGEARALAAAEACRGLPPVSPVLDRLEVWEESRVLCATFAGEVDPAGLLAQRLEDELCARGFAASGRAFRSHVTLARGVPAGSSFTSRTIGPISWCSQAIELLESGPGNAVPRYSRRALVPLSG
jgi:2'-5' RNA ligase